jgi:FkbM family methyltransferase
MENEQRKKLIDQLEKSVNYCENIVFSALLKNRLIRVAKNPIKFLTRKVDIKLLNRKHAIPVVAKTFWGEKMHMFSFEQGLYLCGFIKHEPEIRLTKFFIKTISNKDVFFDIGAHHGFYSMLANKLKAKNIHSFEPTSVHFRVLYKNTKKNKDTIQNKLAIHDQIGTSYIQESIKGISTMNKNFLKHAQTITQLDFLKTKIQTITLDEYCKQNKVSPTIIKLDIEGHELKALTGGMKTIKKNHPIIAVEIGSSQQVKNDNYIKLSRILTDLGYVSFRINASGDLVKIDNIENTINNLPENDFDNIVFKF